MPLFVIKCNNIELSKISALYHVAIARDKRIGTLIGSLFWPTLYYINYLRQPQILSAPGEGDEAGDERTTTTTHEHLPCALGYKVSSHVADMDYG